MYKIFSLSRLLPVKMSLLTHVRSSLYGGTCPPSLSRLVGTRNKNIPTKTCTRCVRRRTSLQNTDMLSARLQIRERPCVKRAEEEEEEEGGEEEEAR